MNLTVQLLIVHGILKTTIVTRKVVGNTQIRPHVNLETADGKVVVTVMKSVAGISIKNQHVNKQT
jgi:hypothetical protein